MLLKDNVNDILDVFEMNFTNNGEDILKKLARGERMINCNNLFFKAGNPSITNFVFLKICMMSLYDVLIDLLQEKISIDKAKNEQKR